jgi:hypothetical protein
MDTPRNLAPVTAAMAAMGFRLVAAEAGTMDSGSARYSDDLTEVIVWKDRSQWFIGDERAVLEPLGFFRAFDDVAEFCEALARYVTARHDARLT